MVPQRSTRKPRVTWCVLGRTVVAIWCGPGTARNRRSERILYSGGQARHHPVRCVAAAATPPAAAARVAFDNRRRGRADGPGLPDRLDAAITTMAGDSEFTEVTSAGLPRGISTVTGFAFAVEIGDWSRFIGYLDRVLRRAGAREYSLVPLAVQGGITRTGNGYAAGCWLRRRGTTSPGTLPARRTRDRWDLAPVRASPRRRRNRRLHTLFRVWFNERGKRHVVANVAIARELACWCCPWP